ncbi:sugar phosphate isomerase/epimerase family protein [Granulicella tundricola]|uniref:Xylose isomerase domain-containing protein TIM barrel n=1 Tax=Granulicella tundricola (strain ATCC BAA-1859 / DSM 23138 / MP5ACTX9) TaxID=1198114 RepID=E8WWU6_GRATM|nr:sugar phosphate isomerase/epimerase [Granulicella tundricola]ADW67424.1 Xylose isomerase domain-containing protein TIM barrel [Granulicella tundricola MP5ACTX9]
MTTRRRFLQLSAATAAATATAAMPRAFAGPGQKIPTLTYGVQLYMLRKQAATDLPGVFRAIHDAGFAQVELYPIAYREPAQHLRTLIADSGLQPSVSGHFDYLGLEAKLDYAHTLGLKYFVCPMIPKDQWETLAGFKKAADFFNKIGQGAKDRGMEFTFHNHCYEFKPLDGTTGWNVLMKETDPALVKLELDCYWLTQGGQNPMSILRDHKDRAVLLHLKDRIANSPVSFDMGTPQHFTELGKGNIDWPGILAQGYKQGIRYAFLDQDGTTIPIPESMKISADYLHSL